MECYGLQPKTNIENISYKNSVNWHTIVHTKLDRIGYIFFRDFLRPRTQGSELNNWGTISSLCAAIRGDGQVVQNILPEATYFEE